MISTDLGGFGRSQYRNVIPYCIITLAQHGGDGITPHHLEGIRTGLQLCQLNHRSSS